MEIVAGALRIVSVLAFLVALVSLIVPLKALRIPTRGRALLVLLVSVIGMGVSAALTFDSNEATAPATSSPVASRAQPTATQPPQAAPQKATDLKMPTDQAAFVAAVTEAQANYRGAANEMAAGGMRALRRQKVCAALKSPQVRDWIGTISTLTTSNDGKGVLGITLAKDLVMGTWNNTLSDMSDKTLIEPGSAVFNAAVQLKKGDRVVFSGSFIPSNDDCYREKSVSLRGSMTAPEYAFRFGAIRAQ